MKIVFTFIFVITMINFMYCNDSLSLSKIDTLKEGLKPDSISQSISVDKIKDNNYLELFISFISNPFTSAALASIITLILSNIYNSRKKKKEDMLNYKTLLITTKNEFEFYVSKFQQLKSEADNIISAISNNNSPIIPTYSLYSKFLENSKISLSKFFKNVIIVQKVGHCHFELSHISERLELLKKELRTHYNPSIQIANVGGFKKLVESNITEFNDTIKIIESEISKIKAK